MIVSIMLFSVLLVYVYVSVKVLIQTVKNYQFCCSDHVVLLGNDEQEYQVLLDALHQ